MKKRISILLVLSLTLSIISGSVSFAASGIKRVSVGPGGDISWSKYPGADKYAITYAGKTWTTKKRSINLQEYSEKKNIKSGDKAYKIVARKGSVTIGKITSGTYKLRPKKVQIIDIRKSGTSMKITWEKRKTQITGYQLKYGVNDYDESPVVKSIRTKNTSATVKDLPTGIKHAFKVRAFQTVNGKNYYSKWSSGKKVKNVLSLSPEKAYKAKFYSYLTKKGLDKQHSAVMIATIGRINYFDSTMVAAVGNTPHEVSMREIEASKQGFKDQNSPSLLPTGMCLWTGDALKGYLKEAKLRGEPWYSLDMQYDYWWNSECGYWNLSNLGGYESWSKSSGFADASSLKQMVRICATAYGFHQDSLEQDAQKILNEIDAGEYNIPIK